MTRADALGAAFFPNWRDNPYLGLLESSLKSFDVVVHGANGAGPYKDWLSSNRSSVDVLHFHWLHYIYNVESLRAAVIRCVKFALVLRHAKKLDYGLVWTMHNVYPHERHYPIIDRWVRRIMLYYADVVIVHCLQAKKILLSEFGYRENVLISPLGNYIGVYPNDVGRLDARRYLQVDEESIVFVHLGMLKPYKGIEKLIDVFSQLENPLYSLLIVGSRDPQVPGYAEVLIKQAAVDDRIKVKADWIDDDSIQYFLRAADVAVYPFKKVLTSSSVMLALSFGLPVIVPALGCLPELISSDYGIVYDPTDRNSLYKALVKVGDLKLELMGERAYEAVQKHRWLDSARIVRNAYDLAAASSA